MEIYRFPESNNKMGLFDREGNIRVSVDAFRKEQIE